METSVSYEVECMRGVLLYVRSFDSPECIRDRSRGRWGGDFPLSTFHFPLSTYYLPLTTYYFLLTTYHFQLSTHGNNTISRLFKLFLLITKDSTAFKSKVSLLKLTYTYQVPIARRVFRASPKALLLI